MPNSIEITDLQKRLGHFVLSIDHLQVPTGFITGFIGENGAGKTTTIKLILDMLRPNRGQIQVLGRDAQKDGSLAKADIGYVGDDAGYWASMRLRTIANITAPFFPRWDWALFDKLLSRFRLDPKAKYISLSKGMKKQFELVIALCHHPKLVILDEPTANLDPLVRRDILDLLLEMMEKEEVTVFFSTHITSDLDHAADYIVFLHQGKMLLFGDKDTIIEGHRVVKGPASLLSPGSEDKFISIQKNSFGFEALTDDPQWALDTFGKEAIYERPDIEQIFIGYTRKEDR
ncbi:ABC transporter ATP-binding protein [Zongyangia hominis]|uniref:ABC transporter ATP-binding protein n=1 Tax=Zongyangia hominis TaxID=2763677 RepID=A0A926EAL2_9FIRM|nr:ABC transporter ATP-binding protein [Zongyangia hominis]MBC8570367.1 ABC transporter ATP-binding protein [Zongyangia hominis]